jgi:hypothetical protein
MDQSSFWTVDAAGAPGKLCRPTMASSEPGRMLAFETFPGFIRGISVECLVKVAECFPIQGLGETKSSRSIVGHHASWRQRISEPYRMEGLE